jgi:hypothetical protein
LCLDVREIQVQRHQHAIFRAAALGEHRIAGTPEFLVGDRIRFEPAREGSTQVLLEDSRRL